MIRVTKTALPKMDTPYAVGYLPICGNIWGICASGNRDGSLIFPADAPEKAEWQNLKAANWGAQMFFAAGESSYFAIQGFLPGYRCESSCLVHITKNGSHWDVEHCFDMPYLHKIAVIKGGDGSQYLLCATLCESKDFTNDWSHPGAVWVSRIPEYPTSESWNFTKLLDPMHKNHGFCRGVWDDKEALFFSSAEGVFAVYAPETSKSNWVVQRILDFEIGDLTIFENTIAAVDGFHGNRFSIYQRTGKRLFSVPLTWGHTAWLGRVGNVPVAVAGELEGDRRILFFADYGSGFELIHAESQIGPFSVSARQIATNIVELLCPARAAGRPVIYRLTME